MNTIKCTQYNEVLEGNLYLQVIPDYYWFQYRIAYDNLSMIIRDLEQIISPLLLLSLSENFIYICLNIMHFDNDTIYK